MKERSRHDLKAQPRPDKLKKPKKPYKYNWEGDGPEKIRKLYCSRHDRQHVITPKQLTGEHPVKCKDHEFSYDFRKLDRIMEGL